MLLSMAPVLQVYFWTSRSSEVIVHDLAFTAGLSDCAGLGGFTSIALTTNIYTIKQNICIPEYSNCAQTMYVACKAAYVLVQHTQLGNHLQGFTSSAAETK